MKHPDMHQALWIAGISLGVLAAYTADLFGVRTFIVSTFLPKPKA